MNQHCHPPDFKPWFLHRAVVFWVAGWILTLPLFHLHVREAIDEGRLAPPILAHTVFSPDLPGEYTSRAVLIECGPAGHRHDISRDVPNYSEIAVGLFNENNLKNKSKPQTARYAVISRLIDSLPSSERCVLVECTPPPAFLLLTSALSRGPPFATS